MPLSELLEKQHDRAWRPRNAAADLEEHRTLDVVLLRSLGAQVIQTLDNSDQESNGKDGQKAERQPREGQLNWYHDQQATTQRHYRLQEDCTAAVVQG